LTRVLAGQHYPRQGNPLGHGNEKGLEELGVLHNILLLDDIDERALREVSTGGSVPNPTTTTHVRFLCREVRAPLARLYVWVFCFCEVSMVVISCNLSVTRPQVDAE
jgi:hypothetical protein